MQNMYSNLQYKRGEGRRMRKGPDRPNAMYQGQVDQAGSLTQNLSSKAILVNNMQY
jgi:hypothetical protein